MEPNELQWNHEEYDQYDVEYDVEYEEGADFTEDEEYEDQDYLSLLCVLCIRQRLFLLWC